MTGPDAGVPGEQRNDERPWRVGRSYQLHVYEVGPTSPEGDLPVATFHTTADAAAAVEAHNGLAAARRTLDEIRDVITDWADENASVETDRVKLVTLPMRIDGILARAAAVPEARDVPRRHEPCANHPGRDGRAFVGGFWLCLECEEGFKKWRETLDKETRHVP